MLDQLYDDGKPKPQTQPHDIKVLQSSSSDKQSDNIVLEKSSSDQKQKEHTTTTHVLDWLYADAQHKNKTGKAEEEAVGKATTPKSPDYSRPVLD
eukprot:9249623-Ditylum_brightwellii.AAC.1